MLGRRWLLALALAGAVVLACLSLSSPGAIGDILSPALPVFGQGLAAQTGPLIGGEIAISVLDNKKHLPAIAFNTLHNEYLVL